ncbi:MAG: amidohydrolase family protein [Saprospiraceae bacterium]|jgi:hypothetical protein|nr:amidohydrolase family protein [Saprospiraceae bacterium]
MKAKFILTAVWWKFLLGGVLLFAQENIPPVSSTYFLKNCTLIPRPGETLKGQHILIKNGQIVDIGPGVKAPFDAQWIQADSFYVYAGFIDGYSNTGIPKQENKERPKVSTPGNPPNAVAGITPEVRASDMFSTSDKSVAEMRNAGFTLSHVVPRGLMLPGQSAVFILGDSNADKMLLQSSAAQNFQFEPQRGVFPSTIIGVMSKFRDLYRNAYQEGNQDMLFQKGTIGVERPDYSRELKSLYPITVRKQSLFVVTPQSKDIHRAMLLQNELQFQLVLAEVKQGWHYLQEIKKSKYPVFLSLDLPEEDKKDAKKEDKKELVQGLQIERDSFQIRRELAIRQYVQQAATFEKEGVEFGFSYLNTKPADIKKSIGRMVKAGLSEKAALRALTTYPAAILGVSHLAGTVEKGKLANLVVTDKPFFDEKSSIKMVFVEGKKYTPEQPSAKSEKKTEEKTGISGIWSYVLEAAGSVRKGKIYISGQDGQYKVEVSDDTQKEKKESGREVSFKDKTLKFHVITDLESAGKVDFQLQFLENKYEGTVSLSAFGSFPVKGERQSDPE